MNANIFYTADLNISVVTAIWAGLDKETERNLFSEGVCIRAYFLVYFHTDDVTYNYEKCTKFHENLSLFFVHFSPHISLLKFTEVINMNPRIIVKQK